ncbi:TetR family transcriptional regulator [Bacillus glycinifermentans]|uniref:TetR family transcriptional regulator n=1 Tax=Bacillus glycinifermentans TaxID=1664069 RepID=A0A0J6ECY5_9BACI|nr:TetR/AcrR family transcriptional regulator [Bacillus glycinifermentans]ATH93953.1 TetR/AcrR family transcriptional regulator [Bacillus glycinifermentans]KMM55205.1 TetR family transcriptional regulator [Bacillus glycinifermentans]KRT94105.1 TetR family transcriptional regulator [Bacillus glycinifermentans]MEC0488001.1 TetR/AcrR family transcriptional regulator [Bacillus glycinifermentans]MEC0496509.1 TetR/AcrR family transcriptional regulator [Bacillus glycinifermentans]
MDRRILKTRKAILEAFLELMGEKNFEQISINEIAGRANVNRGTVYLHYTDKYDLLDQCIDTYLKQLYEKCLPEGNALPLASKDTLLQTFKYLEQNADVYSMLLTSKGTSVFRSRLTAVVMRGVEEQINIYGIHPGTNRDIMVQFLVSAAIGLLEWWIVHSMPYPAEEMVEQLIMLLERHLTNPLQND